MCPRKNPKPEGKHQCNGLGTVSQHKNHGVKVVQCAAASAVCHFHRGAESRERLMERFSTPGGAFSGNTFRLREKSRLQKADEQATAKEKGWQGLQLLCTQNSPLHFTRITYDPYFALKY